MALGLGALWGRGRSPSVPLGVGTGPQPPGPEGAPSAGRAGSPNGGPGLCGGFLEEEGREEQIAKAEWWSSQGASPDHLEEDPAHHPLLPGVFLPPSLDLGRDRWGRGGWNLGGGPEPWVPGGNGGWKGGGELGAGCLGTEQEARFLVSPPTGPAHLCQLPPFSFPTQTACLTSLAPGEDRDWEKFQLQECSRLLVGRTPASHLQSLSNPLAGHTAPSTPTSALLCQHRN